MQSLAQVLERFEPVIGLEVHAQLLTRTKIFSAVPNQYDPERPNRHVNEYCFGLPGVLPVLNREAVAMAIRAGLALGCTINHRSVWARKQYFYPDLPKGYQISQYDAPICEHGHLEISTEAGTRKIGIVRIHMEEDAGKNIHVSGAPYSLVDYNRAGVPLIEIVSAPDLRSTAETTAYLMELRAILRTIGVCDGNMERGSFRCDANVSIRPRGEEKLGTRCEIKNVNSFKFIEQAIEHEILRHAAIITAGGAVEQETRLFDSTKKETRSMRGKEEAHDYRYFPDPDLPVLEVDEDWIEQIRASMPELPAAKRRRWIDLGVPEEQAGMFAEEKPIADYVDAAFTHRPKYVSGITNLVSGLLFRELKEDPSAIAQAKLSPQALAELVELKETNKISSAQQKKLFERVWREGGDVVKLAAQMGEQISDASALEPVVDEVLAANPDNVEKYRSGKTKVINALLGQVMKATKGKANPALVKKLLEQKMRES